MGRFLALTLLLVIAGGVALHQGAELPHCLSWVGNLPGDLIVKRQGILFYLPFTSAVLVSGAISLLLSLIIPRK